MTNYLKKFNIDTKNATYLEEGSRPIDEVRFKLYMSGEMTLKDAEELEREMENRLCYIVRAIHGAQGSNVEWLDYANCDGRGDVDGHFDRRRYVQNTDYTGRFSKDCVSYEGEFPTRWFYQAFEEELLAAIARDNAADLNYEEQVSVEYDRLLQETEALKKMLTKEQKALVVFKDKKTLERQAADIVQKRTREEAEATKKAARKSTAKARS